MSDRRLILPGQERKGKDERERDAKGGASAPPPALSVGLAKALVATGGAMALIGLLDVGDTVVSASWGESGAVLALARPMVGRLTMPAAGLGILAAGAAGHPRALVDAALALGALLMSVVGLAVLGIAVVAWPAEMELDTAWIVGGAIARILAATGLFAWIAWVAGRRLASRRYGAAADRNG